jgi:hypothetical protein
MKKHALNIFPEANEEDFNRLLEDIRNNGFDQSQPVIVTKERSLMDGTGIELARLLKYLRQSKHSMVINLRHCSL